MKKIPFLQDPSATAAFAALRDLPLPRAAHTPRGEKIHAVVIGGGTGALLAAARRAGAQCLTVPFIR